MAETRVSFVPKKASFGAERKRPVQLGSFFIVSIGVLIVSVALGGIIMFYKSRISSKVTTLETSLKRAQDAFDPGLIEKLVSTSKKIESAKVLLKEHKTIVPIFDFLEVATLKNVQFSDFAYKLDKDRNPSVSMSGVATSYATLSLQAEQFEKNRDVRSVKFSNLQLGEGGVVNFSVDLEINPAMLSYAPK